MRVIDDHILLLVVLLTNLAQRALASLTIQAINVEHPVQVIAFVLKTTSHKLLAFNDNRLAIQIDALHTRIPCTLSREPQLRYRKAALVPVLIHLH